MKTLKNILKPKTLIVLIAMMTLTVLTTGIFASSPAAFKDVPASYWGYKNIQRAYTDGVVSGSSYNEATGERYYSPEAKLTVAEFVTILTRAFYVDEVNSSTATGQWYAAAQDVANKHNLTSGLDSVNYNGAASRYQMAVIMTNIMEDLEANMPTPDQLAPLVDTIPDWWTMPNTYKDKVATVFYLGLITGKDDKGTFAGNDGVTRAEAATIYCRLADAIGNVSTQKPVEQPVEKPEQPTVKPEEPVVKPEPKPEIPVEKPVTGNSGAVGTLSDTPVTLSLSTHKPVVDYWSKAPADVQAITDKDVFNAAVQTMKDKDMQAFESSRQVKNNEYYNYACFEYKLMNWDTTEREKQNNAIVVTRLNSSYGTYRVHNDLSNADSADVGVIVYSQNPSLKAQLDAVFEPIFAQFRSGMSDKEKAQIMLRAITERFEYATNLSADETFTWLNGKKAGACGSYSMAVQTIFSAAGIPCDTLGGSNERGAHAWNVAYLDGEWLMVDAVSAESGYNGIMTPAEHAQHWGMPQSDAPKVLKALVDAAYNQ
jgi:hypothetical protein